LIFYVFLSLHDKSIIIHSKNKNKDPASTSNEGYWL
jgi:hypothetical protein